MTLWSLRVQSMLKYSSQLCKCKIRIIVLCLLSRLMSPDADEMQLWWVTISVPHSLSRWHAGVQMSSSHCHHPSLPVLFRSRLWQFCCQNIPKTIPQWCTDLVSVLRFYPKLFSLSIKWSLAIWNIWCLLRGIIFLFWWCAEACLYLETFQQTYNQSQFLARTIKPNFCCWQLTAIHRIAQSFFKTIKLRKLYCRIPEWCHSALGAYCSLLEPLLLNFSSISTG